MDDQNPFQKIWKNINDKLQNDLHDLTELYSTWEDMRTDFYNLHYIYQNMNIHVEAIKQNSGDYIDN